MRVSFAGGGTDLPPFTPGVGGRVVGGAIDLRVAALVEPFDWGWVRMESTATGRSITRRRGESARDQLAFRLIEAALAATGINEGVRIEIRTDIAPGAGLGGSGSAAVAALCALGASVGDRPEHHELARLATAIERESLGLACGCQDQIFAAFGGVMDLTFDDRGCRNRAPVHMPAALRREFAAGLLLVDTLVRRVSSDVIACLDTTAAAQANRELVQAAAEIAAAFEAGSLELVLAAMRKSAAAKLRRDPRGNIFAIEVEQKLDRCGAKVVRLCGAGGGGHVLVWAPEDRHAEIAAAVAPWPVREAMVGAEGVRIEES